MPAAPSPGGDRAPVPLVRDVVARGRDAALGGVAEINAGHVGAHRGSGLVGERAQHLGQLQRHVERPRGAHERAILRRPALLGFEAREADRGHRPQRLGVGDADRGGQRLV